MPPGTSLEFRDADDSFLLTTVKDDKEIKIRIDLRILPKTASDAKPVGAARENPNMEPHLPPPIGRIEFSLNPFKMLVSWHFWSRCYFRRQFHFWSLIPLIFLFRRNLSVQSSSLSSTQSFACSSAVLCASWCFPCCSQTSRPQSPWRCWASCEWVREAASQKEQRRGKNGRVSPIPSVTLTRSLFQDQKTDTSNSTNSANSILW